MARLLVERDGVDPTMAAYAARAAQSHIGLARRLATDEQARNRRRTVVRIPLELRSVGEAVLHAAELLAVATEEAEAGTAVRDGTEVQIIDAAPVAAVVVAPATEKGK